jgi:hypothetical protein
MKNSSRHTYKILYDLTSRFQHKRLVKSYIINYIINYIDNYITIYFTELC